MRRTTFNATDDEQVNLNNHVLPSSTLDEFWGNDTELYFSKNATAATHEVHHLSNHRSGPISLPGVNPDANFPMPIVDDVPGLIPDVLPGKSSELLPGLTPMISTPSKTVESFSLTFLLFHPSLTFILMKL